MGIRLCCLLLAVCVAGCTQGHCRRKVDPGQAAKPVPVEGLPEGASVTKPVGDRVFVYKYDGSLQCGMGKAVSLETMAKELQGIPLLSSVKKPDGLMHIQVCGSITGMANVYEIASKHLKAAEAKGFKRWSFE